MKFRSILSFGAYQLLIRIVSGPYLLRTFFGQKYLWTEKLRTWYGASTSRVRPDIELLEYNITNG
ncbi:MULTISPECIES: hypothetical protein [Bacteroides]|uniref:hypothetical protein n=1 Tax=Bacteroides TaxID=816 RepID=UPI00189B225E|nr:MULTISPECIES: hypothetical protein [Bacteroides]MCB6270525.1 hypothetical protein [Bacteroides cellulosilyticus]MCG4970739.1 hypothetical protein [Bacteroides cellulosilyticus]